MSWWDETRIRALLDGWLAGRTATEIADALDTSRHAVLAKIDRLRRQGGPDAPARRDGAKCSASASRRSRARERLPSTARSPIEPGWWPRGRAVEVEPYIEPVVEVPATAVRVCEVEAYHCRWPLGDPRETSFRLCGAVRVVGAPYCLEHVRMAYVLPEVAQETVATRATGPGVAQDGDSRIGGGVTTEDATTAVLEAPEADFELEKVDV